MPADQICSDCGAKLSPDAQGGLCIRCLFTLGLKTEAGTEEATPVVPITEKAGDWIGRYKLLLKLGEGGCGVVYMAEQEEPVRRRVALKVIKLGMDTREVIARFEAERQALAMMDHPNIAKIFDAGTTEGSAGCQPAVSPTASRQGPARAQPVDGSQGAQAGSPAIQQTGSLRYDSEFRAGRPFFVMELVPGAKITEFCGARHRDDTMNPNREELLFGRALTKPAAERAAWLDREWAMRRHCAPAHGQPTAGVVQVK